MSKAEVGTVKPALRACADALAPAPEKIQETWGAGAVALGISEEELAAATMQMPAPRSIALLRQTLSTLCHFVWHRQTRPGEHLWTIPVDKERDFDCILSDAIDELERLRADALAPPEPAEYPRIVDTSPTLERITPEEIENGLGAQAIPPHARYPER